MGLGINEFRFEKRRKIEWENSESFHQRFPNRHRGGGQNFSRYDQGYQYWGIE